MSRLKKLWSEIKYWLFILLSLGVLFEMVASMMLYRKYATGKFAITHFTERLFGKGPDDHSFARNFTYEPWMMFRVSDYHSERVNVSGFERKSAPDLYVNPSSKDTLTIYFFGGSTMFGPNLADAETIPSQFVKLIQKNNPVKSVRVRNLGIPHYYSKQDLILLTSKLFSGDKPDMVVFLTGMDDFYPARMLYYDRPHFSYALQQAFDGKMLQKSDPSFTDSTKEFYDDPAGVAPEQYNAQLYSKYVNNLKSASLMCDREGIKSYFFCQPVPFFNYPGYKGGPTRFNNIYPMLEKNADSIRNFVFLGNLLKDETASAYDGLDYSPDVSQKIAGALYDSIKSELQ